MNKTPLSASPRYGWVMVVVTFMLTGLSFGGAGTVAVFIKPLGEEFGWSRGDVAFGYSMFGFATIFGILWGRIADKYGARPLAMLGSAGMVVALLLLSRQSSLAQYYGLFFLFGALGHAIMNGPLFSNVGFWFNENKGLAIGVASAGGAIGQATIPFFVQWVITGHGWRAGYIAMAILYGLIAIPLSFLVRESPVRTAAQKTAYNPVRDRTFALSPAETTAWLSVAVIFCCTCMSVPIVHIMPLISDRGVDPQTAASVMTVLMIAASFGRVFGGWVTDKIGGLRAYMLFSFGQTALVPWFPHIEPLTAIYFYSIAYGVFYSGVMTTLLVCVREMIPARVSAQSMTTVVFFAWIGMGFGGYQGGVMFDLTGNYIWSYANASIAGMINLAILTAFWFRIRSRSAGVRMA
ncbi:MAG: MFS transporter [Hyphomicrobiales bacterium]|nr:MFS transporter [Hyphomicrobiales bacterium]